MISKKTWQEFRNTGLLFFINQILHVFGWAIVVAFKNYDSEKDEGEINDVYPARVTFRGFGEKSIDKGYKAISKFMKDNADELLKEANE